MPKEFTRPYNASFSFPTQKPIDFPDEILGLIFDLVRRSPSQKPDNTPLSVKALRLTHVCRRWRYAGRNFATLWNEVYINNREFAALCLTLSKEVDITLIIPTREITRPIPRISPPVLQSMFSQDMEFVGDVLNAHIHRVVNLDIFAAVSEMPDVVASLSSDNAKKLKRLAITSSWAPQQELHPVGIEDLSWYDVNSGSVLEPLAGIPLFENDTPALRSIYFHGFAPHFTSPMWDDKDSITLIRLSPTWSFSDILSTAISRSFKLSTFCLIDSRINQETRNKLPVVVPSPAQFSHLKHVTLRYLKVVFINQFLDTAPLPSLSHLDLLPSRHERELTVSEILIRYHHPILLLPLITHVSINRFCSISGWISSDDISLTPNLQIALDSPGSLAYILPIFPHLRKLSLQDFAYPVSRYTRLGVAPGVTTLYMANASSVVTYLKCFEAEHSLPSLISMEAGEFKAKVTAKQTRCLGKLFMDGDRSQPQSLDVSSSAYDNVLWKFCLSAGITFRVTGRI